MQVAKITLTYFLDEDGHPMNGFETEGAPDLVTQLGMLELAKDTAIRTAMGEAPDES